MATTTNPVKLADEIRYTDNEPNNPLRKGVVEGQVVDVQGTSGGNVRYRIRTHKLAPQGGGYLEVLVYSHEGTLEVLRREEEAACAVSRAAGRALEQLHPWGYRSNESEP